MKVEKSTATAIALLIELAKTPDQIVTVAVLSKSLKSSKNTVNKVVQRLRKLGYLLAFHGVRGGVRLKMQPSEIFIGDVFKDMEKLEISRKELKWLFKLAQAEMICALNEKSLVEMLAEAE